MLVFLVVAYAVCGGIAGALQAPINAGLGKHVGPLQATLVSMGGSFAIMLVINIVRYLVTGQSGIAGVLECEPWMLLGGIEGSFILFGVATCTPKMGVALLVTLSMLGQMFASLVIDGFGLMGTTAVPTNPLRIAGVVLFVVGILLVYKGRLEQAKAAGKPESEAKPFRYMAFIFFCGVVSGIQMPTNVALQSHAGLLEAMMIHFFIGSMSMLLLVLATQKGKLHSFAGVRPWKMLGGICGVVGVMSLIVSTPILGTALNSAAMTFGQLIGAVAIDAKGLLEAEKIHINGWRIAGVALVVASVALVTAAKL